MSQKIHMFGLALIDNGMVAVDAPSGTKWMFKPTDRDTYENPYEALFDEYNVYGRDSLEILQLQVFDEITNDYVTILQTSSCCSSLACVNYLKLFASFVGHNAAASEAL